MSDHDISSEESEGLFNEFVFYMGDISYSTHGERLEMEKRLVNFIHHWLDFNYGPGNVDHRFFVHDAAAYEVAADDFYKVGNAGGTIASVVFELVAQVAFNESERRSSPLGPTVRMLSFGSAQEPPYHSSFTQPFTHFGKPMAKKRLTIAKSASVERSLSTSLEKLAAACSDGDKAVAARTRISKKLNTESRRLAKRAATQVKRKRTAAAKAKATPSVETRKNLRVATVELAVTRKAQAVVRAAKAVNSPELAALKAAQRKASAYSKAIAQADKALNKPKKKRRKARKAA